MSATLNAELFSNYFGGAPTIHIPVSYKQELLLIYTYLLVFKEFWGWCDEM
jgi:hypothetical protein